jgi:plasmid stability protein
MATRKLTVTVPDPLLARLRDRARRANRTVEAEVLDLLAAAVPADSDPARTPTAGGRRPRRSHRAEANGAAASHPAADSPDEALPPDIAAAVERVASLDDRALRAALKPLLTPRQAKRLAELNYKAQAKGLTAAERAEQDELVHMADKSMVVRAAVMAELHKRGVDVAKLIGL